MQNETERCLKTDFQIVDDIFKLIYNQNITDKALIAMRRNNHNRLS